MSPPRPGADAVLAGYAAAELYALADRRHHAEADHALETAALQAETFWSQVESDPDTEAAFDRLTATFRHNFRPGGADGETYGERRPPRHGDSRAEAYGRAALEGELTALAGAVEGNRNNTLTRCSFRLGQLIRGGVLAPDTVVLALTEVARGVGLEEHEIAATVRSGLAAGMARPR